MKKNTGVYLRFSKVKQLLIDEGLAIILVIISLAIPRSNTANTSVFIAMFLLFFLTKSIIVKVLINSFIIIMIFGTLFSIDSIVGRKPQEFNYLPIIIIMYFLLFISLIQAFFIIYKIYAYEVEKVPEVMKCNLAIRIIVKVINTLESSLHKISLIIPFLYYIFFTVMIIFLYANIFSSMNKFYYLNKSENGFYTNANRIKFDSDVYNYVYDNATDKTETSNDEGTIRIPFLKKFIETYQQGNQSSDTSMEKLTMENLYKSFLCTTLSEYAYFSTTTFYTVGYGDIEIRGAIPKLIVQSEMFISSIFNIIFIPLILFVIQDYVSRRKRTISKDELDREDDEEPSVINEHLSNKEIIMNIVTTEDDNHQKSESIMGCGNQKKDITEEIVKLVNGVPIYFAKK